MARKRTAGPPLLTATLARWRRPRVPVVLQIQTAECAVAALAMLMAHHGHAVPLDQLRGEAGVSGDGTTLTTLKAVAASHGFTMRVFRKEPDQLAAIGLPCMVFVNFNHMLVVESVDRCGLTVVDPASGRRRIGGQEFDHIFTGIALRVDPTAAMIRRRRPPPSTGLRRVLHDTSGWAGLTVLAALGLGGSEAALILTLPQERPGVLALAVGAVIAAALALHGALHLWAGAIRRLADAVVLPALTTRASPYFGLRHPGLTLAAATTGTHLAALIRGASGRWLAGVPASLAPWAVLAGHLPAVAAIATVAWTACAGVTAHTFLASGSAWRRRRHEGRTAAPDRHLFAAPEPWQIGGRDDEAMGAVLAGSSRAMAPAGDFAVACARQSGCVAAIAAAAAVLALTVQPDLTAPLLVVLTCRVWFGAIDGVPALFDLPMLGDCLADLLAAPALPAARGQTGDAVRTTARGAVVVDGLGHGHGPGTLFGQFAFIAAPGARIGLTGAAGTGKTTLARLLAGQMEPRAGSVAVGGRIVMVPGQPVIFSATIADNVACWRPAIDPPRIDAALRMADLADEIGQRPDGVHTWIDDDRTDLSGGQRRRLMLARALADAPDILVLDETLDGLDQDGAARVLGNLRAAGLTVIVISQRPDILARCDAAWRLTSDGCRSWPPPEAAACTAAADDTGAAEPPAAPPPPPAAADWAALTRAAARQGVTLAATPLAVAGPAALPALHWQARLHGLILMPVRLHDRRWRRRGIGTLLVRRRHGDGRLDVLHRSAWGGWRIWHPHGGWTGLTAADCAALSADAWAVRRRHAGFGAATMAWPAAIAALAVWLAVAALPTVGDPAVQAAAIIACAGAGAGLTLTRQRRREIGGQDGMVAATRHALGLTPTRLRALGAERLERWCADMVRMAQAVPLARAEAAGLAAAIGVTAAGAGQPVRVLIGGAGAALISLLLAGWRRRAETAARPAHARAEATLWRLLHLLPDQGGTPLVPAVLTHWHGLDHDADARTRRQRRTAIIAHAWTWASPLVGLAAGADCALAVIAGTWAGTALDTVREARRLAEDGHDIRTAQREDQGFLPPRAPNALQTRDLGCGDQRPILDGVSLRVAPGEMLAVAGPSGSGKTTLLRLLMGMAPPDRGQVLVAGHDLSRVDRLTWRAHWAAVLQDEDLGLRSLHAHVRGQVPVGLDQIAAQLARLGLWPWVRQLPMGLATLVDSRILPAGRAAQVLLARALIRRPAMIFLDETLAPMDPPSRALALAAIRASGAACVVVSHQQDVLDAADQVIWLAAGRINRHVSRMPPPAAAAPAMADGWPDPFGPAARLYRPTALVGITAPERRDPLPEPPPSAAWWLVATLAVAALARAGAAG